MDDACGGRGDVQSVAFTAVRAPIYFSFSLQMSCLDVLDYSRGSRAGLFDFIFPWAILWEKLWPMAGTFPLLLLSYWMYK